MISSTRPMSDLTRPEWCMQFVICFDLYTTSHSHSICHTHVKISSPHFYIIPISAHFLFHSVILQLFPPCSMNYSFSFHPVIAIRHTLTSLTCPSLQSRYVFISIHLFGPLHCCPPSQLYTIVTSSLAPITSAHFPVVHLLKPHILPHSF